MASASAYLLLLISEVVLTLVYLGCFSYSASAYLSLLLMGASSALAKLMLSFDINIKQVICVKKWLKLEKIESFNCSSCARAEF